MSYGSAFSLVSATSIIGNTGRSPLKMLVQETGQHDVVDVVGIELGHLLGPKLGDRTVQITGGSG